jgi:hypothetical protein
MHPIADVRAGAPPETSEAHSAPHAAGPEDHENEPSNSAGMAVTVATAETDAALDELAGEIRQQVRRAEESARSARAAALAVGELLTRAKNKVAHGEWERWLDSNCSLAPRTARAYMMLSKRVPLLPDAERQRVAGLPLRQALAAITTGPTAPPREARVARSNRVDDMHRVRELARRLDRLGRDFCNSVTVDRFLSIREDMAKIIEVIDGRLAERNVSPPSNATIVAEVRDTS